MSTAKKHYDVVIIGSGFGGSVSALRLAEKGYKVAVLEAGARFEDKDFPKTSWRLRKFLFFPRLGLKGIQRIHFLRHVLVLAGAGVGGGSLVYANTLYKPPASYFNDQHWGHITDWEAELDPWYDQARRMLGVVDYNFQTPADDLLAQVSEELGVRQTFRLTPVAVHFGSGPGQESQDPFFGGEGPTRKGCTNCGECMTGCRHNAKNTLPKNYLGLAEKLGVEVFPLTTVSEIAQTADGWMIAAHKTGAWITNKQLFTADQVIVAAGAFNTQKLLHRMKDDGVLSRLSDRLGDLSRTNSESLVGAVAPRRPRIDLTPGVAITSSIHIDENTHVESVRYGKGSNVMAFLAVPLTDGYSPRERRKHFWEQVRAKPTLPLRMLNARRWSERTFIALVMQNIPSAIRLSGVRGVLGWRLTSAQDESQPAPALIPQANDIAKRLAERLNGRPMGTIGDFFGAPFTAHFVGGCVIGDSPLTGVIDAYHRVWHYPTLHVVDGAAVTANLGVNPSLTITAQAERALSMWPNKGEVDPRPAQGMHYKRVEPVFPKSPAVPDHAPAALPRP